MTRISGEHKAAPLWVVACLASIAGFIGWLTAGFGTAGVACFLTIVVCWTIDGWRLQRLFEARHDGEKLVFTSRFATLHTSWKNVRSVRAFAGEGYWFIHFDFIDPVSGRTGVTVVVDGPEEAARNTEKAMALLVEKHRNA